MCPLSLSHTHTHNNRQGGKCQQHSNLMVLSRPAGVEKDNRIKERILQVRDKETCLSVEQQDSEEAGSGEVAGDDSNYEGTRSGALGETLAIV